MPRLFRRARTRGQLRDQLMRQLENEAEKLLKQMAADFSRDLASESQRVLKDALSGWANGDAFTGQGIGNLLTTAVNYTFSRPRTRQSTQESARSAATDQRFRLSRSQAAAEAAAGLAQAERNR